MSKARDSQVGDRVTTDYDKSRSGITEHTIIGRKDMRSQSGIGFQVDPPLRNSSLREWIDADWFEVAESEKPLT